MSQTIKFTMNKSYPEGYAGKSFEYNGGRTVAEVIAAGHADSEETIVAFFYGQHKIRNSGAIRDAVKEGKSIDELAALMAGYKAEARTSRKGQGAGRTSGKVKAAETRAAQAEAEATALREKLAALEALAESNPSARKLLASLGK